MNSDRAFHTLVCSYIQHIGGLSYTVNSVMFTGINVCVLQTKPCSRGLIPVFVVSLGLVSCLGT